MLDTTTPDTDVATDTGLDAVQIAAFRKCDDVVFGHHNGASYLRAVKRFPLSKANPFGGEAVAEVAVETRFNDYAAGGRSWPLPAFDGFDMIRNYDGCEWRTIANLLRKGDRLAIHWVRDNMGPDSDVGRAGLSQDEIRLIIMRGKDRLTFLISVSVTASASLARTIRNVRYPEAQS